MIVCTRFGVMPCFVATISRASCAGTPLSLATKLVIVVKFWLGCSREMVP